MAAQTEEDGRNLPHRADTWRCKCKCKSWIYIAHYEKNTSNDCSLGTKFHAQFVYVSDLGVTIDKRLGFTEHIAKIARQALQRANLIHRCFTSKIATYSSEPT